MKIIKKGRLRLTTCPYCDTTLQFDINKDAKQKQYKEIISFTDTLSKTYTYIICPICEQEIDVTKEVNK